MRAPLTFTLVDIEGNPHEYLVPLFRVEQGAKLAGRLLACVSGPFTSIGVAAAMGSGSTVDSNSTADQVRQTFLSGAPADLLLDLVRGATRDSKLLSTPLAMDDAYAGNYLELVEAAWEIIQGNGLLPLSRISFIADKLMGMAAAATTSTATPPAPAG